MRCSERDLHHPIASRDAGGPAGSFHLPLPVSSVRLATTLLLWWMVDPYQPQPGPCSGPLSATTLTLQRTLQERSRWLCGCGMR